MELKVTIIIDNVSPAPYTGEHGFSALVQAGEALFLFDTGQGTAVVHNADLLGIDLSRLDALVISHGHYDHAGGVGAVLSRNGYLPVYLHKDALSERYNVKDDKSLKNISIPSKISRMLTTVPAQQIQYVTEHLKITDNIHLTGPIPRTHPLEDSGGSFYFDRERNNADNVNDEIAVWIDTSEGIVVLTGCCHAGLINTCEHIKLQTKKNIYAVIGGLHLHSANHERLKATADYINESTIEKMVLCHCSGQNAADYFTRNTGCMVEQGSVGYTFTI